MGDFSFLAIPNIEGMRMGWYIQIFGIVILFGVCFFFLLYYLIKYYRGKQLVHHLTTFDQGAKILEKELLVQKIIAASGKQCVVLFIEYLENFITRGAHAKAVHAYANLSELLVPQGFTLQEVQEFEHVVYTDKNLSKHLEEKITSMLTKK